MAPRIANHFALAPAAVNALLTLEETLKESNLEPELLNLVKIRASQINGCAFCLHMHTTEARKRGMDEYRIHLIAAWRDSSLYSHRERAALEWTETLTRVAENGASDADYAIFAAAFSEAEQVQLTIAIGAINLWNRLQVGFRAAHPKSTLNTVG